MRTTALLFLVACLAVVADLSSSGAERVLEAHRKHVDNQVAVAVEDWENGTYVAVGLGACAVAWLAGTGVPRDRRVSRLVSPAVRWSIVGAVACGLGLGAGFSLWLLATGEAGEDTRAEWLGRWLIGSVLGAVGGGAIGGGLGAVAYLTPAKPSK